MTDAAQHTVPLPPCPTELYIGGHFRPGSSRGTIDVDDPADGRILAQVADATTDDAKSALDAACAAQPRWASTPPRERGELLRSAYELIHDRAELLATLMTLEMGKPLAESRGEVAYGAEFFRWFAEEAVRIRGSYTTAPAGGSHLLTMKKAVGPTLMITPWNFPLAMGTRKIGPALAAGCTCIVKPASQTPLTMLALAQILHDVGVPAGVVNVIPSSSTAQIVPELMADPRLRKITFTGSTEVGRRLIEQSGQNVLRVSMELGGNAPLIVFEDADLDQAVEQTVLAKMRNIGEACTAANRLYVHRAVMDEFADRLSCKMSAMTVGPGTVEDNQVGPLIDAAARDRVHRLVQDALADGARLLCGGEPLPGPGHFYPPTVLAEVSPQARVCREEIFGPVAPLVPFETEAEAVRLANDSDYGLMSYVFTTDLARALRMGEALEYGMVGVNSGVVSNPAAPFGGVKQSGLGREGGAEGIEEFLETTYLGIPR
ncbi:succinate-semialdehyde dehydrogenase / glutarate-semialdehyde dehydrogenase [Austwickia chelonae]|uniref:Succinate-semialdehyde dehydrogenase n=1 Tax=Austwickia chelonae NBRC 105200 TaxID=1184607 RepID=K6W413_9MICO|nr:NAD-dependent succinate-semialdehyde dehydrogenase [Austwickia chelonae]GAB76532.1 succinate-semialdehyde dehydrogenase [Austwickia chelonae NBRC 105200]SEW26308.1 succinate-semialdehyde dehydrogenase / glutarate-semialdehyde dehydrogenase [Austwickia chelonae]